MGEFYAGIIIAALPVSVPIIIVAGLVLALIVGLGGMWLARRNKNKQVDAPPLGNAGDWQRQNQMPGQPGSGPGWGQPDGQPAQWGQQQQQQQQQQQAWNGQSNSSWGDQNNPASGLGGWNASANVNPQQPVWGQQGQQAAWGQQGVDTSTPAWGQQGQQADAQPVWGQQPAAQQNPQPVWGQQSGVQNNDPWNQQKSSSPSWNNSAAQPQQQDATAYRGSNGAQPSWNGSAQPAQPAWDPTQPQQQQNAFGINPQQNAWQQPQGQTGFGANQSMGGWAPGASPEATSVYSEDNDRTVLRGSGIQSQPLSGRMGLVRVEEGKELGRVYEIRKESMSMGRSRESDIFLEDLAVSRFHASLLNLGNGNYAVKDEGSANGTKVNGQQLEKSGTRNLQDGDRVQLGQTVLVFGHR